MKTALFLHYGPGGNAALERIWYPHLTRKIDFWDQPVLRGPEAKYSRLLDSASERLKFLFEQTEGEIAIIGHDFGCRLALDLTQRHRERIAHIKLIAPLPDVALAEMVHRIRDYQPCQWANEKAQQKYESVRERLPHTDFTMWRHILADYLSEPHHHTEIGSLPLQVIFGDKDPFISCLEEELKFWSALGAKVTQLSGVGHCPHLESDVF